MAVAGGLSNLELADSLHISMPTAKMHVSRIWPSWAHGTAPSW